MENDQRIKEINPILVIAIFVQISFIVFAGITINNILARKPEVAKINIDNYPTRINSEDSGSPVGIKFVNLDAYINNSRKSAIDNAIYEITSLNNTGDNIANNKGKIRQDSLHSVYIEDLGIYFLNFIVDIEDLGQSYRIICRWADKYPNKNAPVNGPVVAFCPRKEELIYGEFNCRDQYNNHGEDYIVYSLLKNKTFDGNFFINLFGDVSNGETLEKIYISPVINNEETRSNARDTLRRWFNSLGFDLDNFNYEFSVYDWT